MPTTGNEMPYSYRGAAYGTLHVPVDAEYEIHFRYYNYRGGTDMVVPDAPARGTGGRGAAAGAPAQGGGAQGGAPADAGAVGGPPAGAPGNAGAAAACPPEHQVMRVRRREAVAAPGLARDGEAAVSGRQDRR